MNEIDINDINVGQDALEKALQNEVWDTLVRQIVKCNVIPVIGNEMVRIGSMTSSQLLLSVVSRKYFGIQEPVNSYTALLNHPKCKEKCSNLKALRNLVYDVINNNPQVFRATDLLKDILSIKYFPFVITTVIDPVVENTMREIHGDSLRVLHFVNDPQRNQDIENSLDISRPTLYYMFGRANDAGDDFVLSDMDLLRFSRSWLLPKDCSDYSKPARLSTVLSNKYLLVLGNDFQDWLFRFFWFAMKDEKIVNAAVNIPNGMDASEHSDERLIEFLNSAHITSQISSLPDFVSELRRRLEDAGPKTSMKSWFDRPEMNVDVFISYSRQDSGIAQRLYRKLCDKGVTVWYDKENLGLAMDFNTEIRNAIRTCRMFVPILSDSITAQAGEEHVYRLEWRWAIEHKMQISSAFNYIAPLSEESFDMYSRVADVPEDIRVHNAAFYKKDDPEPGLDAFVDSIYEMLNRRKNGK